MKTEARETTPPEWVPKEGGTAFATQVKPGINANHDGLILEPPKPSDPPSPPPARVRRQLSVDDYVQGVLNRERAMLGRAITLVESNAPKHIDLAQAVLQQLLPHTGQAIRVGITGVPGVGKSTFIEKFGCYLLEQNHQVAVLAIDPTSTITGGSIMGDKTRMAELSRQPNAFIRPSPTGGTLGGVTRKSRETMLICEAFGFDIILVETVGVGQSEVTVRSMVDFFLALMLPGAGDELQGIKKGLIELADALLVNKADGDNLARAKLAQADYNKALHYLAPATEGWQTRAYTCSAITGEGIAKIWAVMQQFQQLTTESGLFAQRRRNQTLAWVKAIIEEQLKTRFFKHPAVVAALPGIETAVLNDELPALIAAQHLLNEFDRHPV